MEVGAVCGRLWFGGDLAGGHGICGYVLAAGGMGKLSAGPGRG